MRVRHLLLAVLALLLLPAATCKTKKPASDSTPPRLEWVVVNSATNASQTFNGSGTLNAKRGDFYKVTLKAIDPEGIHRIRLGGEANRTCVGGSLGQAMSALQSTDVQTLNPDSDGNVLTQIFLLRDANLALHCNSGFSYSGGNLALMGSGENYFSGITNGTLTFNVTP